MYESKIQCPKCLSHKEHIYVFEKGRNNAKWYIERCSNESCQWNYDAWTPAEYRQIRDSKSKPPQRDNLRLPPPSGWQFGL